MDSNITNSEPPTAPPTEKQNLDQRPVLAIWGPSQSGKSLLVAHVIQDGILDSEAYPVSPASPTSSSGAPERQFLELIPQTGSSESTSLPTRFSTALAHGPGKSPVPVRARLMTRAEWLGVLAAGFALECERYSALACSAEFLSDLVASVQAQYPAASPADTGWRRDLVDTYALARELAPQTFTAEPDVLSRVLADASLDESGYVTLASELFWEQWGSLTSLFVQVERFLRPPDGHALERHVPMPCAFVPLMLSARRSSIHTNPNAKCYPRLVLTDFHRRLDASRLEILYRPEADNVPPDLRLLQAATLELQLPMRPERVMPCWQAPLRSVDLLDVPGPRLAGEWRRTEADTEEEQMEIVKRGKAVYRLWQACRGRLHGLLILQRGGMSFASANQMQPVLTRVLACEQAAGATGGEAVPVALGLTGFDEEFANRECAPSPEWYGRRFESAGEAFGQAFLAHLQVAAGEPSRVFPIRFPGTWDRDEMGRRVMGPEKWEFAGAAFCESEGVRRYVPDPENAWRRARDDSDAGHSSVIHCFFKAAEVRNL